VIALYMLAAGWIGFMLGFFLAALMSANGRDR
jgi:hypothetical protein